MATGAKKEGPLPLRFLSGLRNFIDPRLKAGRVPFTRTVLILQLVAALIFVGYTLVKKQIQVPLLSPDPYYVEVVLPDAAGLDPSKEPAAGVAGAQAGRVVEVHQEEGQAIATLRLNPDLEGKIFADATASLRPINVLQVLIVNIHPGNPASGPLPEGARIEADHTDAFVHIDQLTSILDADTQAQVQILISEAATALRGREPELRQILDKVGEVSSNARPLARALDHRRDLIRRLVDHLDVIFTTLAKRRSQVAEAIDAGSQTLAVTAGREVELADATRQLAPVLIEAQRSLSAARQFSDPLVSALDQINPVAPSLQPAAAKIRALIPRADSFLTAAERLVDVGARPVHQFQEGTKGLEHRVNRDLRPAIRNFSKTIDALDKYKGGIAQTADLWSSAFSLNANGGPYSQVYFGATEVLPEGLGFPARAKLTRADGTPGPVAVALAEALEKTCRETNPLACELRFGIPELPAEPLTSPLGAG